MRTRIVEHKQVTGPKFAQLLRITTDFTESIRSHRANNEHARNWLRNVRNAINVGNERIRQYYSASAANRLNCIQCE